MSKRKLDFEFEFNQEIGCYDLSAETIKSHRGKTEKGSFLLFQILKLKEACAEIDRLNSRLDKIEFEIQHQANNCESGDFLLCDEIKNIRKEIEKVKNEP